MTEEKKTYDLTAILTEENEEAVKELVKRHGNEDLVEVRPFTKVNLAYPVKGYSQAFMSAIKFSMDPGSLEELKDDLNNDKRVLRHLVLKVGKAGETGKKTKIKEKPEKKRDKREDFVSNKDLEEKIKELE